SASPVTSGHQLAATSQRSLPVCASSPFQSSSVAKPYFESDHFIGGGPVDGVAAGHCRRCVRDVPRWCDGHLRAARAPETATATDSRCAAQGDALQRRSDQGAATTGDQASGLACTHQDRRQDEEYSEG